MKLVYDKVTCKRCGGSGEFSRNAIHGTMCYGCGGHGTQLTPTALKSREQIRARRKALTEKFAVDAVPGDVDGYNGEVAEVRQEGEWVFVTFTSGTIRQLNPRQILELPLNDKMRAELAALGESLPGVKVQA